jgi:hypothetical protein
MYIAYMIQWWVFAVIMPITWLKLLHREAQELERKARVGAEDDWDDDEDDWDDEDEELESEPVPAAAVPAPSSNRGQTVE